MAIEEEPVTQTHLTKKTVRMANLPSADSEEVCPEVPLSGSYTFSEIPKRKEHIEKEALILDDFERQAELELASALERANEAHSSLPPAPLEKGEVDGSEKRRGERQYSEEFNTAEAKDAATKLVGEIESDVQLRLGMVVPASVPSSVEITDEELLSTGDVSSPEYFKPSKISSTTKASMECETPEGLVGVSSSSSEFFTAREDNTLKSSSDDTRPKSWDSSLVCQFPSSGSGSEYQTAVNPSSSTSSSRSYLGNLSSASGSGTLVASQIDLDSCMLDEEEEDEPAPPPPASVSPQPKPMSRSVQVGQESPNLLETRLPVTLTSSNSGTTVCTQVESTYESRVQGDPEVDDQDGNIYDEAELSALFLSQQSSMSLESPDGYERPRTPEPLLQFNEASQLEELFNTEYCTTGALPYLEPQHQLEDIEEEGSLKNSPKSVLSLEMSGTSLESSGGERVLGRPVSRESSSSLNEFERLESALLAEDAQKDPLLSEIEEGHESQVSEASDETEICGEEPIECEVEFDWDGQPETETGPILPPRQGQESPQFTNH